MKTYVPKPNEVERKWWLVDAKGKVLGRLASEIARILMGKSKVRFSPHLDGGDHVICTNAEKVVTTGRKREQKFYYHHSGYIGGLKAVVLDRMLKDNPQRVIQLAVKGMLPKNRIGRKMLRRLKVYRGESHPHQAQNPEVLDL